MHCLVEKDTRCGICVKKMCIYQEREPTLTPYFHFSTILVHICIPPGVLKKKKKETPGTQLVTPPQLPLPLRISSSTF